MKANRYLLPSILVAALFIRVAALVLSYNSLDFDASFYQQGEIARNILAGRGMTQDSAFVARSLAIARTEHAMVDIADVPAPEETHPRPDYNNEPGYGMFLAAVWGVTGSMRWIYPRLLQIFIDVFMCWALYRVGTGLFSRGAGLLVSGFYAIFVPQIEMAVRPYRDAWVTFLFIVSLLYLMTVVRADASARRITFASVGIALFAAMVCWMRSTVLVYPVFLAAALFILLPFRSAWKQACIVLAVFAIAYAPFVLRSAADFDKPMATRGALWHSFWGGIGQFPNPYGVVEDDQKIYAFARSVDPSIRFDSDAYEQLLKRQAFGLFRDHPVFYASTVLRRAAVILFPRAGRAVLMQAGPQTGRTGALNRLGSAVEWGLYAVDIAVGVLFLYGIWVYRRKPAILIIALLPLAYTVVTLAPLYVTGRNIANSYCSEMLLASVGAIFLFHRLRPVRSDSR